MTQGSERSFDHPHRRRLMLSCRGSVRLLDPRRLLGLMAPGLIALCAVPPTALAAGPERPMMTGHVFYDTTEGAVMGAFDPGQTGGGLETYCYEFLYRESAK